MRAPDGEACPHPNPLPQGERERREPRWAVPFMRALERTGQVRAAADDAGIDHSTAYARRRAHADFAAAWAEALRAHKARVKAEEEAEIAALKNAPPRPVPLGFPSPEGEGMSNGQ